MRNKPKYYTARAFLYTNVYMVHVYIQKQPPHTVHDSQSLPPLRQASSGHMFRLLRTVCIVANYARHSSIIYLPRENSYIGLSPTRVYITPTQPCTGAPSTKKKKPRAREKKRDLRARADYLKNRDAIAYSSLLPRSDCTHVYAHTYTHTHKDASE